MKDQDTLPKTADPDDCNPDRPEATAEAIKHYPTTLTKRQIKRAYLDGEIGLSDALPALIFDHAMERCDAYKFLGLQ